MNKDMMLQPAYYSLPFLGEMSLGKCLDKHNIVDQINIPTHLISAITEPTKHCFTIKMTGNSMQASGILHNDLLVVQKSSTAKNNCIVFATIDNLETVIKHFEQTNDLIILSNRDPDIKPMIFNPSRIKIVGTLVATLRSYH